jgi:hypothetical protein
MTAPASLSGLRSALAAKAQEPRDSPVRVHNRLMTTIDKQCEVLASTAEGRDQLAAAARSDPDPFLRLAAAKTVQGWDHAVAREVFEDLVRLSGGVVVRPMTMTAALSVKGELGRSAALCLLDGPGPLTKEPANPETQARTPVASALLDAGEQVYGLAMNGGLDHAYELVGDQFPAAAEAYDAVGAPAQASALRDVVLMFDLGPEEQATRDGRAAAIGSLDGERAKSLEELNQRFWATDDLMERLEQAIEG